jgi:hypothetical protein
MRGSNTIRRLGAYAAVLCAALASIATSAPAEWSVDEAVGELSMRLDTSTPEAAYHFTVRSSQAHQVRIEGKLAWDQDQDDPQAAVLVGISDDAGQTSELTERAVARSVPTELVLAHDQPCAQDVCEQSYSVLFKLVDGWPSEHVDVSWSFHARISGDGGKEPDDAFVEVIQH